MTTHSGADGLGAAGLRFEREGPIGWCIIDRPEARNAFTPTKGDDQNQNFGRFISSTATRTWPR